MGLAHSSATQSTLCQARDAAGRAAWREGERGSTAQRAARDQAGRLWVRLALGTQEREVTRSRAEKRYSAPMDH